MVDHWWLNLPWDRCGSGLKQKLYIPIFWERFDKLYVVREAQNIKGEEIPCKIVKLIISNRIYNEGVQRTLKLSEPRIQCSLWNRQ